MRLFAVPREPWTTPKGSYLRSDLLLDDLDVHDLNAVRACTSWVSFRFSLPG